MGKECLLLDMVQYLQKYLKRICYFIHILALPHSCITLFHEFHVFFIAYLNRVSFVSSVFFGITLNCLKCNFASFVCCFIKNILPL